ncbi:DUF370 domain-containing protein [Peribacillus saganii]|uniref:DUF370 domain-containing protein n=1 Tax=Peribacillus saganii TaxID=2303992 RepID=A0A372LMG9_9BACI|nr:extracellular matrix/biofilm biosynthesis regulator RemA family protein [Peribacillus saganii]RFU67248.1 DUF370 domain-containing protein [Peribacillus saganii]
MYLHVGEDILIKTDDIIAILDKQLFDQSSITEDFLKQREQVSLNLAKGSIKSVVITDKHIYYSPLSSGTLKKRSQKKTILFD